MRPFVLRSSGVRLLSMYATQTEHILRWTSKSSTGNTGGGGGGYGGGGGGGSSTSGEFGRVPSSCGGDHVSPSADEIGLYCGGGGGGDCGCVPRSITKNSRSRSTKKYRIVNHLSPTYLRCYRETSLNVCGTKAMPRMQLTTRSLARL
jgi:hypothetical protein